MFFFSLKPHRFDLFYVILPLKQHNSNVHLLTPFTKQQLMPQEELEVGKHRRTFIGFERPVIKNAVFA
jgi:hypothetical protein